MLSRSHIFISILVNYPLFGTKIETMAETLKCNEWPILPTEVSREKVLQLPKWDMYLDNDVPKLKTSFSTSNFKTALSCLQRIGDIAERQNHHPGKYIESTTHFFVNI